MAPQMDAHIGLCKSLPCLAATKQIRHTPMKATDTNDGRALLPIQLPQPSTDMQIPLELQADFREFQKNDQDTFKPTIATCTNDPDDVSMASSTSGDTSDDEYVSVD
jgi:hypothetical protein